MATAKDTPATPSSSWGGTVGEAGIRARAPAANQSMRRWPRKKGLLGLLPAGGETPIDGDAEFGVLAGLGLDRRRH